MTKNNSIRNNWKKGSGGPKPPAHDPRIIEFVRILARMAAEADYDNLVLNTKSKSSTGDTL